MALRDKKDMQRQLLISGLGFLGLVVIVPLFIVFTVAKPTPSIAPSAIPLDGNTCARIGFNWIAGGQVPVTPQSCLDDIAFAQRNGWDVMQTLQQMKRDNDRQSCLNSQRTPQGQDACRRQYR